MGETVGVESAVEVGTEVESGTVVALGCSVGEEPVEADADCWRGRVGSGRDG